MDGAYQGAPHCRGGRTSCATDNCDSADRFLAAVSSQFSTRHSIISDGAEFSRRTRLDRWAASERLIDRLLFCQQLHVLLCPIEGKGS